MAGRIADIFTNGGYSDALASRDALADTFTGQTGYSKAQTNAIRMANELARGRASKLMGDTMSMPAAQRIALSSQSNLPAEFYDFTKSMNDNAIEAANMRVAQQQANAMNAQERLMTNVGGITTALGDTVKGVALMEDPKAVAKQVFKKTPAAPVTEGTSPEMQRLVNANPDKLFDTDTTWKQAYTAHKNAGMSDKEIKDKFDNTKWGREGKFYQNWSKGVK